LGARSTINGATGWRRTRLAVIFALLGASLLGAASARAALPGGYSANPVNPIVGSDRLGESIVDAGDITGDGKDDLLVGMPDAANADLPNVTGKVAFVDGANGGILATVSPPLETSHVGDTTQFGARVATLGDVGSCAGSSCNVVGPPDAVPDHLVSAPGADISNNASDVGIVYVLDGKTHQVMKRIELASDDRPPSASPGYGLGLASPAGERPCASGGTSLGGVGACSQPHGSLVTLGDVNGDGKPDAIVGAPDYTETADTSSGCTVPDPQSCPGMGRVYVYSGADITGSPGIPIDTPLITIRYFDSATAAQQPHFGSAIAPIGDVGMCDVPDGFPSNSARCFGSPTPNPSATPDGYPDFLVSAPGLTAGDQPNAGVAMVVDGRRGLVIAQSPSPNPQTDSGFASFGSAPRAPGDLAGTAVPDLLLGAPGLDSLSFIDQGTAFVLSGDVTAAGALATFDDPLPGTDGRFGTSAVGLGDVAGDSPGEAAVGRGGGGPVRIFSPCKGRLLQTIPVPGDASDPGSDFGAAIAPMGDLNGDGYLDLAIGAPGQPGDAGQVYLMKSDGTSGPSFEGCAPPASGGGGGAGGGTSGTAPASGSGSTPKKSTRKKTPRVRALVRRTVRLSAAKKVVKAGQLVTMKGRLSAKSRSCRVRQKISLERLNEVKAWLLINVGVTKRDGSFATSTRPSLPKSFYRARVLQTRRCGGAVSKRVKVRARPAAA
jgi:FG-GAP repeat